MRASIIILCTIISGFTNPNFITSQLRDHLLLAVSNISGEVIKNNYHISKALCVGLDTDIDAVLSQIQGDWGVSIIDENGFLLSDHNGSKPLVPASNMKLISTGYALEKLGRDFRLKTSLYLRIDGIYEIIGQGDPDLTYYSILSLFEDDPLRNINSNHLELHLYEEDAGTWWPESWALADRNSPYGPPITRLALNSNSLSSNSFSPIDLLEDIIAKNSRFREENISRYVYQSEFNEIFPRRFLVKQIHSAPLYALISLANSESHNFTSEILLRVASDSWESDVSTGRLLYWLMEKGIDITDFSIRDGSGLSRDNKLTTNGIASLLYTLSNETYSDTYISSLSIAGVKGTLADFPLEDSLVGNFYGKSGTLNGVRSLSGILEYSSRRFYISIIANDVIEPDSIISELVSVVAQYAEANLCLN